MAQRVFVGANGWIRYRPVLGLNVRSNPLDVHQLGTDGFLTAGRNTYGDAGAAVGSGGVMPSFGDTLTPQEIATVVFYERVVLGGQDVEEAVFDSPCPRATPAARQPKSPYPPDPEYREDGSAGR